MAGGLGKNWRDWKDEQFLSTNVVSILTGLLTTLDDIVEVGACAAMVDGSGVGAGYAGKRGMCWSSFERWTALSRWVVMRVFTVLGAPQGRLGPLSKVGSISPVPT